MAKAKEDDVFFVGVQDPIELRRSILESSKDLLQYMQRFEKFKEVRMEKQEQFIKLGEVTAEIAKLVRKLKTELPKTHIRARMHKHEEEVKKAAAKKKAKKKAKATKKAKKTAKKAPPRPKKKEAAPKPAPEKPLTDLEKLEAELGAIETRLTKMT